MPDQVQPFGFCAGTYQTRNRLYTSDRAINWYPSIDESGHAVSKIELSPTPGLATFTTLTDPPVRGLWVGDNRLFAVGGNKFHEVFADGSVTDRGIIGSGSTPVQIAASGLEILIASGDSIWRDPGTGTIAKVLDGAISVVYIDGYYVAQMNNSNRMQFSFGDGGVTWDPLDFIDKMGSTDRSVRLEVHEGHIWVFGRKSIIPYYNSGDADSPWQPIQGAVMDVGTMAPWTVTKIDQTLFWLGQDYNGYGRVYRSQGYTPVRISNMAIEHLIKTWLEMGDDQLITGKGYTENGHTFYVLSFPLAKATLVYDLTTEMWHERARWNSTTQQWEHWRGASFHAHVFGKHFAARIDAAPHDAGDERKIYQQSVDIYTDDGLPIRRYRAAPYIATNQQWLMHHYLKLFVNGNTAIDMRYQLDDGVTWSNTETAAPFKNEIKYRRLGRARDRLYEVSLLDSNTKSTAIMEAYLHATAGEPPR